MQGEPSTIQGSFLGSERFQDKAIITTTTMATCNLAIKWYILVEVIYSSRAVAMDLVCPILAGPLSEVYTDFLSYT